MGLTQLEIDVLFRPQLIDDGIGRFLAFGKAVVVGVAGQVRPSKGNGKHRDMRLNGPVVWRERTFDCLSEWVREYYDHSGGGLHLWAQKEMGWLA